jgi:hypothetical protein
VLWLHPDRKRRNTRRDELYSALLPAAPSPAGEDYTPFAEEDDAAGGDDDVEMVRRELLEKEREIQRLQEELRLLRVEKDGLPPNGHV